MDDFRMMALKVSAFFKDQIPKLERVTGNFVFLLHYHLSQQKGDENDIAALICFLQFKLNCFF